MAGDADEVRAVVDAQPVGVDLVHQVAGLARVQPLGDHRLDRRPRARRARRGARRSCRAGWRSGASSPRPIRTAPGRAPGAPRSPGWRSGAPRRRSAGATGSPAGRPGSGRARCWARARRPGRSPSSRSKRRICPATCRSSESTSSSRFGASGGSPRPGAPRVSSSRHWPSSLPSATTSPRNRGCVDGAVRERPAGADRLAGADRRGVDAGADDLQRRHLALAAEQHRVVGQRSRERHPHHLAGAGVERHVRSRALERAQLADRLLGDQPPGASPTRRRRW